MHGFATTNGVRPRRTDFNDAQNLSDLHRTFGASIHMTDIDCFEYKGNSTPVAIIDYKCIGYGVPNSQQSSMQLQKEVANRLGIPFFAACYDHDYEYFILYPQNSFATKSIRPLLNAEGFAKLTIEKYAKFQHFLRYGNNYKEFDADKVMYEVRRWRNALA